MTKTATEIVPLNGYIAVRPKEIESNSPIVLPKSAKEQPSLAVVVAAAEDAKGVSEGDTVIVPKYAGSTIKVDDEDLLFIKSEDLLGIIRE